MLSTPFRNSKRYPALLRYVVEQQLNGSASELKERIIAIDVFGRDPYYDPSADPVVRISAGEVRKRLAQYYQDVADAGRFLTEPKYLDELARQRGLRLDKGDMQIVLGTEVIQERAGPPRVLAVTTW